MLDWLLNFLLGFLPWWLYWALALGGAIAAVILVPNRLGILLAVVSCFLGFGAGGLTVGYDVGWAVRDRAVQAAITNEQRRLEDAFQGVASNEDTRAVAAEQNQEELQKGVADANREIDGTLAGTGAPGIVVPESVARRVHDLRGRR